MGNDKLMDMLGIEYEDCFHAGTMLHVSVGGIYCGHIVIADEIKDTAKEAIAALKRAGVEKTVMLTGDAESVAASVAAEVGLTDYEAELLPADKVMDQAVRYIRIYLLSVPMVVFYNMTAGGMRAYGDSRSPFLVLVCCGLLNVVLDALFILWIPMGVAGVAIATAITQTLSAVLVAVLASRKGAPLRLNAKKLGVDRAVLADVLRVGLPTGVQTIIVTFSNVMVQYYINEYGDTAVAAFATYYKVENFIYLPIVAFGQAATTFAGQNTGAGNWLRLRKGIVLTAVIGAAVVGCLVVLFVSFPRTIVGWFMKDPDVVSTALRIALVSFPFYWIYPILEVTGAAVRGMGRALASMAVIVLFQCVLRVALLAVFSSTVHTIEALASVYPITWAATAVVFAALFAVMITARIRRGGAGDQESEGGSP